MDMMYTPDYLISTHLTKTTLYLPINPLVLHITVGDTLPPFNLFEKAI